MFVQFIHQGIYLVQAGFHFLEDLVLVDPRPPGDEHAGKKSQVIERLFKTLEEILHIINLEIPPDVAAAAALRGKLVGKDVVPDRLN
ncbi:hypothetical protein BMS3Abin14_01740 [bacterium BMS3Abin14]|nr:hypothetical protein BMS3Abin14_01740 [bacterium BMS3Abin14]